LRQELLDCIGHKFLAGISDDLAWRAMSITGSPVRAPHAAGRRTVLRFVESDDDDDGVSETPSTSMKTYWHDVRERYRAETCDAVSLASSPVDVLPDHWTVVSVSLTEDKSTLIVSRQRPRREPVIVYLPINRQDRRDDGGEDQFTWDIAIEELESIIRTNNETTRVSRKIAERQGRIAWWSERVGLDQRLKSFVDNVEYCWLGVFKVRPTHHNRQRHHYISLGFRPF
jgi:separase